MMILIKMKQFSFWDVFVSVNIYDNISSSSQVFHDD